MASQANVAVQVVLPAEAEVAERRARHAKLDAITKLLCSAETTPQTTPRGEGVTTSQTGQVNKRRLK